MKIIRSHQWHALIYQWAYRTKIYHQKTYAWKVALAILLAPLALFNFPKYFIEWLGGNDGLNDGWGYTHPASMAISAFMWFSFWCFISMIAIFWTHALFVKIGAIFGYGVLALILCIAWYHRRVRI